MPLRVIKRHPLQDEDKSIEHLQDEFYTVAEVAQLLKVSKRTIYTWIEFGLLPAIKIAHNENSKGTIRISKSQLEEFLKQKTTI